LFTISSHLRQHTVDYGVLLTDGRETLTGFQEKPVTQYQVSRGIYMVSRDVLHYVPAHGLFGFDHLMRDLLEARQTVSVRPHGGYWLDIGRADDYQRAIDEFPAMK